MITSDEQQKDRAVATHSAQAGLFDDRYRGLDAYASCFNYSRHRLDGFLARLKPGAEAAPRLLDVGCGTGHHLAEARSEGHEVAGVDGSLEMLERARRLNPGADLRQADVERLPFEAESFDVVLCVEVLRYLPDVRRCVGEMARVLRPGGTCLVTASPRFSLSGYPLVNRLATAFPLPGFVRLRQYFHTSFELRKVFGQAGFRRVDVHGVYFGPINWVERLAPRLLPRVLRAWEPVDELVADRPLLRDLSSMLLVRGER